MMPDECASMRSMARCVLPVLVGPSTAVTPGAAGAGVAVGGGGEGEGHSNRNSVSGDRCLDPLPLDTSETHLEQRRPGCAARGCYRAASYLLAGLKIHHIVHRRRDVANIASTSASVAISPRLTAAIASSMAANSSSVGSNSVRASRLDFQSIAEKFVLIFLGPSFDPFHDVLENLVHPVTLSHPLRAILPASRLYHIATGEKPVLNLWNEFVS